MKKEEIIEKYGVERYNQYLLSNKNKKKTKDGRSQHLIDSYIQQDKKYNRGECTLTTEQLIQLWENGFHWCGETDWTKLGADRIDETKPHTIDNVVCSCSMCNTKRHLKSRRIPIFQYSLSGCRQSGELCPIGPR